MFRAEKLSSKCQSCRTVRVLVADPDDVSAAGLRSERPLAVTGVVVEIERDLVGITRTVVHRVLDVVVSADVKMPTTSDRKPAKVSNQHAASMGAK